MRSTCGNAGRIAGALVRLMGLAAIFFLAGYLFSVHFDRTFEEIDSKATVQDRTGSLSAAHRDFARGFARGLKERYGLDFKLTVEDGGQHAPPGSKTVVLAIDPAGRRARLALPPLLSRALGHGYADDWERSHFEGRWTDGAWTDGLEDALLDIWQTLSSMEEQGGESGGQ